MGKLRGDLEEFPECKHGVEYCYCITGCSRPSESVASDHDMAKKKTQNVIHVDPSDTEKSTSMASSDCGFKKVSSEAGASKLSTKRPHDSEEFTDRKKFCKNARGNWHEKAVAKGKTKYLWTSEVMNMPLAARIGKPPCVPPVSSKPSYMLKSSSTFGPSKHSEQLQPTRFELESISTPVKKHRRMKQTSSVKDTETSHAKKQMEMEETASESQMSKLGQTCDDPHSTPETDATLSPAIPRISTEINKRTNHYFQKKISKEPSVKDTETSHAKKQMEMEETASESQMSKLGQTCDDPHSTPETDATLSPAIPRISTETNKRTNHYFQKKISKEPSVKDTETSHAKKQMEMEETASESQMSKLGQTCDDPHSTPETDATLSPAIPHISTEINKRTNHYFQKKISKEPSVKDTETSHAKKQMEMEETASESQMSKLGQTCDDPHSTPETDATLSPAIPRISTETNKRTNHYFQKKISKEPSVKDTETSHAKKQMEMEETAIESQMSKLGQTCDDPQTDATLSPAIPRISTEINKRTNHYFQKKISKEPSVKDTETSHAKKQMEMEETASESQMSKLGQTCDDPYSTPETDATLSPAIPRISTETNKRTNHYFQKKISKEPSVKDTETSHAKKQMEMEETAIESQMSKLGQTCDDPQTDATLSPAIPRISTEINKRTNHYFQKKISKEPSVKDTETSHAKKQMEMEETASESQMSKLGQTCDDPHSIPETDATLSPAIPRISTEINKITNHYFRKKISKEPSVKDIETSHAKKQMEMEETASESQMSKLGQTCDDPHSTPETDATLSPAIPRISTEINKRTNHYFQKKISKEPCADGQSPMSDVKRIKDAKSKNSDAGNVVFTIKEFYMKAAAEEPLHTDPAPVASWIGSFILKDERTSASFQAHPTSQGLSKVIEFSKNMPEVLEFELCLYEDFLRTVFKGCDPDDQDIGLYFFPDDRIRPNTYISHLERLSGNFFLRGRFEGVELLVFTSKVLHKDYRKRNNCEFLWGIFRRCHGKLRGAAEETMVVDMDNDIPPGFSPSMRGQWMVNIKTEVE